MCEHWLVLRSFLDRILGAGPTRESGPPTSSNGASSCHLYWDGPPRPLREVSVTVEVIERPSVPKLFFWALQVNFERADGSRTGGAHFGLQFHPSYRDDGAVNWGGYRSGGGVLDGSASLLPSALGNEHTRDFQWETGRPYRYRIAPSPERGWRGSITDLLSGEETVVRDLWAEGDRLVSPMVWTEAFADCGDAPAAVRWSDLEAVTSDGAAFNVSRVRVNYQSYPDGGCTNSDCLVDGGGFVQRTGTARVTAGGSALHLDR